MTVSFYVRQIKQIRFNNDSLVISNVTYAIPV